MALFKGAQSTATAAATSATDVMKLELERVTEAWKTSETNLSQEKELRTRAQATLDSATATLSEIRAQHAVDKSSLEQCQKDASAASVVAASKNEEMFAASCEAKAAVAIAASTLKHTEHLLASSTEQLMQVKAMETSERARHLEEVGAINARHSALLEELQAGKASSSSDVAAQQALVQGKPARACESVRKRVGGWKDTPIRKWRSTLFLGAPKML